MRIVFLGNHMWPFCSEVQHRKTLESLGHTVKSLQETQTGSEEVLEKALEADLFIWVHTHGWQTPGLLTMREVLERLRSENIPSLTFHLDLWLGLQRQEDLRNGDLYKNVEYFFTADKQMADWFNRFTRVKGHYMPAAVFDQECYLAEPSGREIEVAFVGSRGYHPEWPYRPELIDWLQETYGDKFHHYGGDGEGVVRGTELNQLYADTKVVVGDSLNIGFDYPDYSSDRLWESTGRGAFLIYPDIKGITDVFFRDGKEVVFYKYRDFDGLKEKIDYYLEHDEEREKIRKAGFRRTKREGTYKHRWKKILEIVKADHGRMPN